jgi:hypothetical protein
MSPLTRIFRVVVYVACSGLLAAWSLRGGPLWWTLLCVAGLGISLIALRQTLGRVVLVDDSHLTVQLYWPHRRRVPWYRIDHVEIVPGSWVLVVETIAGKRLELPCLDGLDDLYEQIEHHRRTLDSI